MASAANATQVATIDRIFVTLLMVLPTVTYVVQSANARPAPSMQGASAQTNGPEMTREKLASASDPRSDQPMLAAGVGC